MSLIAAALLIHKLFVAGRMPDSAFYYLRMGLGFLRVSRASFYWHVIPMLSAAFTLLLMKRRRLAAGHFRTGLFLLILAAGNSLYFFGRSHEHNIINLSSVLLFSLFLFFDLVDDELALAEETGRRLKRFLMPAVAVTVVLLCAHYYSGRAVRRLGQQYAALQEGRFFGKEELPDMNTRALRAAVGASARVVFVSLNDAFYDLESGFRPEGYFGFTAAYAFKKELIAFLNDRLANGATLAIPLSEYASLEDIPGALLFSHTKVVADFFLLAGNNLDLAKRKTASAKNH